MSPGLGSLRRTQLLHEACDCSHLSPVGLVSLQGGHFRGERLAGPQSSCLMHQRRPDRLRLRKALRLQLAEGPQGIVVKSH